MNLPETLHELDVERLRTAIEKRASFWKGFKESLKPGKAGKMIGKAFLAASGAAATAAIGHGVSRGYDSLANRIGKGRAYKGMLQASPGLAKRKDADRVQMTFNTLWNLNRDLAKDPLTAGSFVERSVQRADFGDSAGSYVDIETARNILRSAPREDRPIARAFIEAGTGAAGAPSGKDYDREAKLERYKAQLKGFHAAPPAIGRRPPRGRRGPGGRRQQRPQQQRRRPEPQPPSFG